MPTPDQIPPRKPSLGGGAFIVFGLFAGTFVGFALGQATIGFLIGTAAGIAVAGWLAWRERG